MIDNKQIMCDECKMNVPINDVRYVVKGNSNLRMCSQCRDRTPNRSRRQELSYKKYPAKIKWAILSDMVELGQDEKIEHQRLAKLIIDCRMDKVILMGPRIKEYTLPKLKEIAPGTDIEIFLTPIGFLEVFDHEQRIDKQYFRVGHGQQQRFDRKIFSASDWAGCFDSFACDDMPDLGKIQMGVFPFIHFYLVLGGCSQQTIVCDLAGRKPRGSGILCFRGFDRYSSDILWFFSGISLSIHSSKF